MKKVEYEIAISSTSYGLRKEVTKLIKKGWKCQGGIATTSHELFQAMIRTTYNEKPNTGSTYKTVIL